MRRGTVMLTAVLAGSSAAPGRQATRILIAAIASRSESATPEPGDDRARHEDGMLDCTIYEEGGELFETCCRAAEQEARAEIAESARAARRAQTFGVPVDTPEFSEMDLPRECR